MDRITRGTVGRLLMTPEEAAQILGIGRSKMYQLLMAGQIVSVTIDKCRRVPVAELEAYVERLVQEAKSAA